MKCVHTDLIMPLRREFSSSAGLIALGITFASTAAAQSAADSSAVVAAALQVTTTTRIPVFVLGYRVLAEYPKGKLTAPEPGMTKGDRLQGLVREAAASVRLEVLSQPPESLQDADPRVQRMLNDAAWIPHIMRFGGSVGIDSLVFESATLARMRYTLTSFVPPKPSRPEMQTRWLRLRSTGAGSWRVEADELETHYEGQFYSFARPESVGDPRIRQHIEEVRATLRKRGVVLP